jgi:CheY-like chemotaxis protein/HPt (histidine-containing phosphotransfer) domain-containing protein
VVNQQLAIRQLEKLGHHVTLAENGEEAVNRSAEQVFDLILMDMQMPVMNGLEATECIRQREAGTEIHLPIIAMTANAMQGDKEICLEAGMDGYVSKPFKMSDLIAAISTVCRHRHTSDAVKPKESNKMSENSSAQRFNRDVVMERLEGDQELFVMLAEMFVNEAEKYAQSVRTAADSGDIHTLEREAHTVKGVLSTFADDAGTALALSVERAAREGDHAKALAGVDALCQAVIELSVILKAEI